MTNRTPLIVAIVLLLLPVLYVGSYAALVVPGGFWNDSGDSWRHYRIDGSGPRQVFWPLEQIDRKVRPRAWNSPEVLASRFP